MGKSRACKPQPAGFRIGERDAHAFAVHHPPKAGHDLAQQRVQIEGRDDAVGEVEQQTEPLAHTLRLVEIARIVDRQGDLSGNERQEADFVGRIRVDQSARDQQAAELPMRRAERQRTQRPQAQRAQALHRFREARLEQQVGNDDDFLMLVHPPRHASPP